MTDKTKQHARNKGIFVFCGRCVQFYDKNCYCDHCYQVYPDYDHPLDDTPLDGRSWIQCNHCELKWNHSCCELKRTEAADEDMRAACQDDGGSEMPYYCMRCRKLKKIKS